jgi:RNA polymerase sigma factor (sigma-70 family)
VESFDELAVQYQPMIHKIIQSLHIYRNEDEFYQTGLIALWEAKQSFNESKGSFSNYAYAYIKGKMLTQMTRNNQHQERHVLPEAEFWECIEDQESSSFLERETILSYCESLSKKEARWVLASFMEQLTNKEIAKKENVSISAVKQWKSGALRKLREKAAEKN